MSTKHEIDHPDLALVRMLVEEQRRVADRIAAEIDRVIRPGMRLKVRRDKTAYPCGWAVVTVERVYYGIISAKTESGCREFVYPHDLLEAGNE